MQAANGGEAAARALIELGVEFVFTLTGGHLNHIHQILEKSPVRLVDTRHEQAADGGGGDALPERGHDTPGDEDEACLGAIGHADVSGGCANAGCDGR